MLKITGRQTPFFKLSDINELAEICEYVFEFSSIYTKHLTPFEINTYVRLNEINRKVFFAENDNYFFDCADYISKLRKIDLFEAVLNGLERLNSKSFDTVLDLRLAKPLSYDIYSGDYLCIFNKHNIPKGFECFIAISADAAIQTDLLRYENYDVDYDFAIGLVKI
jgi:hypothetical protein